MHHPHRLFVAALATVLFVTTPTASANDEQAAEWSGKKKDGTTLTLAELQNILAAHTQYIYEPVLKSDCRADLTGFDLSGADLKEAILFYAILRPFEPKEAIPRPTNLRRADLTEANLRNADLRGADLTDANLTKADLSGADLSEVIYDPLPGKLPHISSIACAENLELMTYEKNPFSLEELREEFRKAGLRDQERKITFAINHQKRLRASSLKKYISYWLWEFTCKYGMEPFRPLLIVLALLFYPFFPTYLTALQRPIAPLQLWKIILMMLILLLLPIIAWFVVFGLHSPITDLQLQKIGLEQLMLALSLFLLLSALLVPRRSIASLQQWEMVVLSALFVLRRAIASLQQWKKVVMLLCLLLLPIILWFVVFGLHSPITLLQLLKIEPKQLIVPLSLFLLLSALLVPRRSIASIRQWKMVVMFLCLPFLPIILWIVVFILKDPIGKDRIWVELQRDKTRPIPLQVPACSFRSYWYAFYFSLLSACRIGWRGFDLGNWLLRIQPSDQALSATGWVKTVSGIQSVISFLLAVLTVLVYFGRPFQ